MSTIVHSSPANNSHQSENSLVKSDLGSSVEESYVRACLTHLLCSDQRLPVSPQDIDWSGVYLLLFRHRLTGIFYHLGRTQSNLWPEWLQHKLRRDYHTALLWGDQWLPEVNTALDALQQANIAVIVLKGWSLIFGLYQGDHGKRTYDDIDLLILAQDAERADGILQELGCRPQLLERWPGYQRRYCHERKYLPAQRSTSFTHPFTIGLHWQLLDIPYYARRMPVQGFFGRARPIQVAGVDVLGLAPEDDLVYACGHLALQHSYDGMLLHYYEMASLVYQVRATFDWDAVIARALDWHLRLPVHRVLSHIEALWQGIVPARVLDKLADLPSSPVERYVHHWLTEKHDNLAVRTVLAWLTMSGLGRRWRYLFETAFPCPAYLQQSYGPPPGGLWPLLYLRRAAVAVRHVIRGA